MSYIVILMSFQTISSINYGLPNFQTLTDCVFNELKKIFPRLFDLTFSIILKIVLLSVHEITKIN